MEMHIIDYIIIKWIKISNNKYKLYFFNHTIYDSEISSSNVPSINE